MMQLHQLLRKVLKVKTRPFYIQYATDKIFTLYYSSDDVFVMKRVGININGTSVECNNSIVKANGHYGTTKHQYFDLLHPHSIPDLLAFIELEHG